MLQWTRQTLEIYGEEIRASRVVVFTRENTMVISRGNLRICEDNLRVNAIARGLLAACGQSLPQLAA